MNATYEDDPQIYADLVGFKLGWRDLFWRDDFLELIVRRMKPDPSADVLDLGCGFGHWGLRLLPILPGRPRLTGLDPQTAFLDSARQRATQLGLGDSCKFVRGDAMELPFSDASFDLVTAQLVLIHVPDVHAVLREAARVLRPGGVVLLVEPDNQAGNHALLNSSLDTSDADIIDILALQRMCERGKKILGEGDDSIGGTLPGMLAEAGFSNVDAAVNERCMHLAPPYDAPHMRTALEQELLWAKKGITVLLGTRQDAQRRFLAAGRTDEEFSMRYSAIDRWLAAFREGVANGSYHAARGFVMYLVSGRKPT